MEIKVESPQEEEEVEPIGSFRPVKEKKSGRVSIPVRETEQRRKRPGRKFPLSRGCV